MARRRADRPRREGWPMRQPEGPPTHARLETTSGGETRVEFWVKHKLATHILPPDASVAAAVAIYRRRGMHIEDRRTDGQ
jgi:hypothetical protein